MLSNTMNLKRFEAVRKRFARSGLMFCTIFVKFTNRFEAVRGRFVELPPWFDEPHSHVYIILIKESADRPEG